MKLKYDSEADAAYIYLGNNGANIVSTQGEWPFHIDVDNDGNVVGIEVMDASKILSTEYIKKNAS